MHLASEGRLRSRHSQARNPFLQRGATYFSVLPESNPLHIPAGRTNRKNQSGPSDSTGSSERGHALKLGNILDVLILSRLWLRPMSGYEIRQEIFESHRMRVSFGTLYPHLYSLEKAELVVSYYNLSPTNKRKRTYSLTAKGGEVLKLTIRNLEKITDELAPILSKDSQELTPI